MFIRLTVAVNVPDSGVAPGKASKRAVNFRFLRVMVRKDGKVQTKTSHSELIVKLRRWTVHHRSEI